MSCYKLKHCYLIELAVLSFLLFTLVHAEEGHHNHNYRIKSINGVLGIERSEKAEDVIPFDTLPPEERLCTDFTWTFEKDVEIIKGYKITSQKNKEEIEVTLEKDTKEAVMDYGKVCRGDIISYVEKRNDITIANVVLSKPRLSTTINIVSEVPICLHYTGDKYKVHNGKLDSPLKNIRVTSYHDNSQGYYDKGMGKTDNNLLKEKYIIYKSNVGWKDIALDRSIKVEKYKAAINATLPLELKNIAEKAEKIQDERRQIKCITNGLVKYAKYRRNYNNVYPESFEDSIKKKNGNCKELATMTAAILQSLGYKVAPVSMGLANSIEFPYNIPALAALNWSHVVVYATSPKGKEYLIDPAMFIYDLKKDDKSNRKVLSNRQINIAIIEHLKNGNLLSSIMLYPLFWISDIIKPQIMLFLDTKLPRPVKLLKEKDMWILEEINMEV